MGKSPQPALRKGSAFKETSPVVRIISMAIMGGRLGVKFETYNTVYTVVQDLF